MSSERWLPRALACLVLFAVAAPAAAADVPAFSGERALALVEAQCDLGPRTPGSDAAEALRVLIETTARKAGLTAIRLPVTAPDPRGGPDLQGFNLVVSAGPADGARLWLAAHYDTRPWADQDPDPKRRDEPIPGANDGGSGTAVLLHLLELFGRTPPPQGVDLIFLDLEDSGLPSRPATYCLGAQDLARTWRDFGSPLAAGTPRGLVLLDMVGDKDLRIPMERTSLLRAGAWTRMVFDRAATLGLDAFVPAPGKGIIDDHVPFLDVGIPAVDLIDFDYPAWHTTGDTPAACSAASLEQVGRLVTDLAYRP